MQTGELSIALRSVAWDDESEITHHERNAEAETKLGLEWSLPPLRPPSAFRRHFPWLPRTGSRTRVHLAP